MQERNLRDATSGLVEKWNKAFFMPTAADRYVGAFRQWLTRFAGKGVQYAAGVGPNLPPSITNREDLLDRYHTVRFKFQILHGSTQLTKDQVPAA